MYISNKYPIQRNVFLQSWIPLLLHLLYFSEFSIPVRRFFFYLPMYLYDIDGGDGGNGTRENVYLCVCVFVVYIRVFYE